MNGTLSSRFPVMAVGRLADKREESGHTLAEMLWRHEHDLVRLDD